MERHALVPRWMVISACVGLLCVAEGRAQEVSTALYVRTDSDHTTVVSPRLSVQTPAILSTRLRVTYAVDVWTSASIDIVSSASRVPVTEQRDELVLTIDHALQDLTVSAAYRYSIEPDYESHGATGSISHDFADNNATLALSLSGNADEVGRAGDPRFSRELSATFALLAFTQVLSKGTVSQVLAEVSRVIGYQGSPYRYVAIGGGACTASAASQENLAPLCVSEVNPSERLRLAAAVELRHALGQSSSLGAGYRFYADGWGVSAHTLSGEFSWLPLPNTILAARYRFYTQSAADHYRARYLTVEPYVTSDKELSPLSSHRIGLDIEHTLRFQGDRMLTATASLAPILYAYRDFAPLHRITAFEATAALVVVP